MEVVKSWKRFRLSYGGGSFKTHRDTMMSYVSRERGSVASNSNSEEGNKRSTDTELKLLTIKTDQNDLNENHKTNGHIRIPLEDESQPMITETSTDTDNFNQTSRSND